MSLPRIYVDKIGPEGLSVLEAVSQNDLQAMLGPHLTVTFEKPVAFSLHFTRLNDMVHVRGTVQGDFVSPCARCLQSVPLPLHVDVSMALFPKEAQETAPKHNAKKAASKSKHSSESDDNAGFGDEMHAGEEDAGSGVYANREIDILELLHDDILLALPMRVVCREECAGFCKHCGCNLNESSCTCEAPIDPRWEALKKLKSN